jgi:hypothetical protein
MRRTIKKKVVDIVGLYLNPLEQALVLGVAVLSSFHAHRSLLDEYIRISGTLYRSDLLQIRYYVPRIPQIAALGNLARRRRRAKS